MVVEFGRSLETVVGHATHVGQRLLVKTGDARNRRTLDEDIPTLLVEVVQIDRYHRVEHLQLQTEVLLETLLPGQTQNAFLCRQGQLPHLR